ncbi:MAG: sugar ABC transporter permease [Chloroflexi bacterium]|nr:sugar ABC transporter permease [Chloroflexota bacterium]
MTSSRLTPATREQATFAGREQESGLRLTARHEEWLWAAILLLPSLVLFAMFVIWPALVGLYLSFTNYRLLNAPEIIGFAHYARLVRDPDVIQAAVNTAILFGEVVPAVILLSFLVAVLLNQPLRFREVFQVFYFLPLIASPVATAAMFRYLLYREYGLLNSAISLVYPARLDYLGNTSLALHTISALIIWGAIPVNVILYLAALQQVPPELHEAAAIDGAGTLDRFRHITWPLVTPTTFMLIILNALGATIGSFDLVRVLTNGGPLGATTTLVYLVYQRGFIDLNMGFAAALGYTLFVGVLIVTLIQFRLQRRWVHY